jgi:acetylornithine deacetylase/succinyl-diaminopimelate desuccinylase-like protein
MFYLSDAGGSNSPRALFSNLKVCHYTFHVLTSQTIDILQGLIRLDTSNPPGNEMIAARYLADILRAHQIEPTIIETAPNRGNVIARIKGNGNAKPLLLYSHTDVVPVERDKWTMEPFGAEIKDGYMYGRGTVDMKGIGAMQMAVFLEIARSQMPLQRDIIIAATADEETGTNEGIGQIVDKHPDLLRAEYAFSEFGGFSMTVAGKTFYPIQTAEKGTSWLTMRAKGTPGHASVPHNDNAVVHLARAVSKLGAAQLPMHMTPTAREMSVGNRAMSQMQDLIARDKAIAGLINELNAVTHNTCAPTGLTAGIKTNVIPSDASAMLDCRTLPGFGTPELLDELRKALGNDADMMTFEVDSESPPIESDPNTPMFKHLTEMLKRHDPQGTPMPYMLTGATDAKHVSRLGTICYGFSPMKFSPGERFSERVHGHDERIALDSLAWGVQVLYDTVVEFCRA